MTVIAPEIEHQWKAISSYLMIDNEQEYDLAVERLNHLLDKVGDDESHPLYSLLNILGLLIEAYDDEHYPLIVCSGIDALAYLMEEHSLSQSDLSEIGSQGVVSEILSGKRKLNVRQIQLLAERFHVSPATFFDV
ncbi:MAG: helix-turn-helix domain-containing protein [Cyanobacteria bacterium J06648_1]